MPHFSTICNGGYDFWVCRDTSSSLTSWKFTEVWIQTHARNFIWLLCFSNSKSLGWIIYVFSFLPAENTSLPKVGNNGSHSDPFCAEQINASALLYSFFFLHIREAKVQIMKKTCVWRLLACSSNKISNLLTDMWTNEETTVWFMRCFILLDTATIRHLVVCENLFWNLLVTFITDIAGYFCCACNKLQK